MTAKAYYNEIDPFAAAWLRELIAAGHIAPGDVDERSIEDVRPSDLAGYSQCHFFAGIGVWSHALRRAGWADDRPVWTGSCPCQPFSAAGKGGGFADERHLWPAFFHLIRECRPGVVFGEQVASKDGLGWLDLVQADLEGAGYACGAVDTCAAGFGAPHIRQRLYWCAERLADAERFGREWWWPGEARDAGGAEALSAASGLRHACGVADANDAERRADVPGRDHGIGPHTGRSEGTGNVGACCTVGGLADSALCRCGEERQDARRLSVGDRAEGVAAGLSAGRCDLRPGQTNGLWRDADWLFCRDGKWRPVEPGAQPLVDGAPARVGFVCAACLEGSAQGADDEDLRALREAVVTVDGRLPKEVLQSTVPMGGTSEETGDSGSGALAGPTPVFEQILRDVRSNGREPPPPQGREPEEQRAREYPDPLSSVPHQRPSCERCGSEGEVYAARISGDRVGRLRGYGNAINAEQATAFVEAYLEARVYRDLDLTPERVRLIDGGVFA